MSTQTLSTILAAILVFVLGWSVLLRDRSQRTYLTFGIWCFNLALVYLFQFLSAELGKEPLRWTGLLVAAAVPLNAERFFHAFLARDPHRPAATSHVVIAGSIAAVALLGVSLIYPIHRSPLFLLPFWSFVFGSLARCVYLIHQRQRSIDLPSEATKLTYLLYGGAATVVLSATELLPGAGIPFPALGNAFTVVYLYFISQTLIHYRLLDIKELLAKIATLSALVLLLSLIYGLLVSWVGRGSPGVFSFNTVVASITVLLLFDPLRSWVETRFNRWLFAEKYEFASRLRQLIQDLANIIAVPSLVVHVLGELERSGRVTNASIYLANPSGAIYHLAGQLGAKPPAELDARTRAVFLERLRTSGLLTVEGLELKLLEDTGEDSKDAGAGTRNALGCMADLHAHVSIPLMADGQLLGMLNVTDDRLREAYASDELELIRQVAAQAAITLRNSQIYEQMKERDRLAALGQMAAGLAHEIRNPLGAIKGSAQLLRGSESAARHDPPEEPDEAEDADGLLGIIIEEVDRLDHVVSQFLGYARPDRGERQNLNVNEIVHRTLQLLRSRGGQTQIKTDLATDLPPVRADPDQLRQVFINLALNAFEAMDGQGLLEIATRQRRRPGGAPWSARGDEPSSPPPRFVEIAFSDDGRGIPSEVLPDIFIPFFTTREGGTGLGLPISQRIVQNHGGAIEVQSAPGAGSTFSVVLPAAPRRP